MPGGGRVVVVVFFAGALIGAGGAFQSLGAQAFDGGRAAVHSPERQDSTVHISRGSRPAAATERSRLRRFAPLASALVPGAGQFILGDDRFVGYLAVEALSWWMYSKAMTERADRERQFKALARDVARAHYSTTFPDADWSYYEWMRDRLESGVYSRSMTGPVLPETDTSTYNGKRWETLQSIYPTREEALARYEQVAIKPEFRWSWRNHQLEYDIFKRYTDKRNDANRAAVRSLLLVGANHVLSLVDAFATIRVRTWPGPGGETRLGASVRW